MSTTGPGPGPFALRLRTWRAARGLSQLRLAEAAGSTSRHISFLETGRSRPGRDLVLRLGAALDLAPADRNDLLHAAGLPPAYPRRDLTAPELASVRHALDLLLTAHEPFPALVVDGRSTVLAANAGCTRLFGVDLVGTNLLRSWLADPAARSAIVNWDVVARSALDRLRRQADRSPFDRELAALVRALAESGEVPAPSADPAGPDVVVCPWFRIGDRVVRTLGMAARFDTAVDVTVDELRVELLYPLDAEAERFFRTS